MSIPPPAIWGGDNAVRGLISLLFVLLDVDELMFCIIHELFLYSIKIKESTTSEVL